MAKVQNYQCPACGGPLAFDAASAKLACSYCGSSFDPAQIAAQYGEQPQASQPQQGAASAQGAAGDDVAFDGDSAWNTSALNSDWGSDAAGMKEFNCPSCGATIICDQTTAATSCPYCDNPTIVQTQFEGSLHPDYIIPFKVKKDGAVQALKEFYKGKPLLPKAFAEQNHLEEAKGVYVPFWFFDGTASGAATFSASNGSTQMRGESTVRVTRSFRCRREGEVDFKLVPVDASKRMDDDLMDSVEPYDYAELRPFSTGFLPGYLADVHDVSAEECFGRANRRCAETCLAALRSTVQGYESVSLSQKRITLKQGSVHYGLLPVYILNTTFEDKKYTFAVNGQSGKVVGDLPASSSRSAGRFFKGFLTALAVGLGIVALISMLAGPTILESALPLFVMMVFFGLIAGAVSLAVAKSKMKTVAQASGAGSYADGTVRLFVKSDDFLGESVAVISQNVRPQQQGGPQFAGQGGSFGGSGATGSWGAAPGGTSFRPGSSGGASFGGQSGSFGVRPGGGFSGGSGGMGPRPSGGGSFANRPGGGHSRPGGR